MTKNDALLPIKEIELPSGTYKINGEMQQVDHTFIVSTRADKAVDVEGLKYSQANVVRGIFSDDKHTYCEHCRKKGYNQAIDDMKEKGYLRTPPVTQGDAQAFIEDAISVLENDGYCSAYAQELLKEALTALAGGE